MSSVAIKINTMRVLIISALFAVAASAPSNVLLVEPLVRSLPTISPGDIQAAAIDAQVQANDALVQATDAQIQAQDLARAAADKAQELNEQAVENVNEKVVTDVNVANERSLEAFWSAEDQKWQAVDAVKTAEAEIDGEVAKNARALAQSAISGYNLITKTIIAPVVPPIVPVPIAPVAPVAPVVYNPYVAQVNPVAEVKTKLIRTEIKEEGKPVAKPAEEVKEESNVTPALKAVENLDAKPAVLPQPLVNPVLAANVYRYNVVPGFGQVLGQPIVNYAYQPINGVIAPTLVKTVW